MEKIKNENIYTNIIVKYLNGNSLKELSKLYNIPFSTLYKTLNKKYNFKQVKIEKQKQKFNENINFIKNIGSDIKHDLKSENTLEFKEWQGVKERYYFLCINCKLEWKYITFDQVKQSNSCLCDKCSNKLVSDNNKIPFVNILEEVKNVNSDIRKYKNLVMKEEDWDRVIDKYWLKCNKCSDWFYKEYRVFIRKNKGTCRDCKGLNINWNIEKVRKYCINVGSAFLSYIWNNVYDKYKFTCTLCGKEIEKSFTKFYSGQTVCTNCAYKIVAMKTSKSHEEYLLELKNKDINIVPIDKYESYNKNIKHICPKCGREDWLVSPANILSKKSRACINCKESIGEEIIAKYLLENKYKFIKQFKFENLKSMKNNNYFLKFDFAIFDKYDNLIYLIEYDGEQHFYPVNFNGISDEKAEKNFKQIQINDKTKNNYCMNNNIKLLRIPYWEFDNIVQILCKY